VQFFRHGSDIPEHLLQAHEDGPVVFFYGAGISYPRAADRLSRPDGQAALPSPFGHTQSRAVVRHQEGSSTLPSVCWNRSRGWLGNPEQLFGSNSEYRPHSFKRYGHARCPADADTKPRGSTPGSSPSASPIACRRWRWAACRRRSRSDVHLTAKSSAASANG
jgi:hypothetical protein